MLQHWRATEVGLSSFGVLLDDLLALRPHRLSTKTERAIAALGEVLDAPYMGRLCGRSVGTGH